jgi:hypothetical protein
MVKIIMLPEALKCLFEQAILGHPSGVQEAIPKMSFIRL